MVDRSSLHFFFYLLYFSEYVRSVDRPLKFFLSSRDIDVKKKLLPVIGKAVLYFFFEQKLVLLSLYFRQHENLVSTKGQGNLLFLGFKF